MYVAYVETRDIIQNLFVEVCSRENASTDQISLFWFLFLLILFMMTKSKKKKRSRFKEEYLKKKDSTSQNSLQLLTKMYVTYVKTRDVIQKSSQRLILEKMYQMIRDLFSFLFLLLLILCIMTSVCIMTSKNLFFIMTLHIIVRLVYFYKLFLIDSLKANSYSLELSNFYIRLFKKQTSYYSALKN